MGENLYSILGINKGASDKEIKKAYRQKAKQYHPDKNPGDKTAEENFKKASEAYEVLSDPQKKQNYDRFGTTGNQGANPFGGGFEDVFSQFGDMFGGFGGQYRGHRQARRVRGRDLRIKVEITLEEAFEGLYKKIKINRNIKCGTCDGNGGHGRKTCGYCRGTGQTVEKMRTPFGFVQNARPCITCNGIGYTIEKKCNDCKGRKFKVIREEVAFDLFEGIEDGTMMTMKGKGDTAGADIPGDLLIVVYIKPHERYQRVDLDLRVHEEFNFIDLILGGSKEIETISGKVLVKIAAGTALGATLKLAGKGMKFKGRNGDMYLTVSSVIPTEVTEEEKEILGKLRKKENFK